VETKGAPYIPVIPALAPGTSTRDGITNNNLSLTVVGIEVTKATKESMADMHHVSDCAVHQKM